MNQILPFEVEDYASVAPVSNPLFYNNFGDEVLTVWVRAEKELDNSLIIELAAIPFLRDATRTEQTTVQMGVDFRDRWLRWPLLGQQLSIEELRAADKTYRDSLRCTPKQWRERVKQFGNDPRWSWLYQL